jgi:hypothetical protein
MQSINVSSVAHLDEALADIRAVRIQIARGAQFRGFGPASIAASGTLALAVAITQWQWPNLRRDFAVYLTLWVFTALASLALTGTQCFFRTRRRHAALANKMLGRIIGQWLPPLGTGALLTAVVCLFAPQEEWLLPGVWQLIFSLGVFASRRLLPRGIVWVGLWYVACGLACLYAKTPAAALSPWEMGIPFGVGQWLVAAILQRAYRHDSLQI